MRGCFSRVWISEEWNFGITNHTTIKMFGIFLRASSLSAPGFFLLMGIGAVFLHNARKRLWGPSKILRYFFIRGAILIVLSLTLFNYFFFNPQDGMRIGLGVLFPLGMDLLLCGCLIVVYEKFCTTRFRRIVGNISILLIAFIIYCITEFVVHWARKFPDSTEFHPLIRLTILTGRTGILFAHYTFLPWLVPCLWGVFFGLTCKSFRGRKAAVVNLFISFALFCIYLLIHHFRSYGTLYPASVEIPLFDNPVIDFLYNTKYPPSLAFLTLMLGINHLLLSIAFIFPISTNRQNAPEDITSNLNGSRDLTVLKYCKLSLLLLYRIVFNMLLAFGKSALFFYVLHFFGYMVISAIVHAIPRYKDGTGIGGFWPWWFLGVLCYWPVCSKFERFKHSKPVDSVWRFF
ncbi:hypothetical protein BKA69DRAFT_859759 [Paraphysoderma sedebokerense]|nr:hypothetical protein BKA69DRAFT_859759 [Paraphysoderma sedebokerense]